MRTKSTSIYLIYTWLFLFGFLPISLVLFTSLLTQDPLKLVTFPLTLSHFKALFSPLFAKIFLRSVLMATLTTLGCLLMAYPFSYFLVKSKHQSILIMLIIIPFWTSSLIRTYSLIAILKFKGILNLILLKLHLITQPISMLYTNFAVLSGLIYNLFPFMVLPIFSNMERFDFRLIEAAEDLGASKWATFFRVFLPNTTGGIISGCMLVFLPAMTMFYIPDVLGGARSILLGNMIQSQFLVSENWPQGAATSTTLTALLLVLLLFYRRHTKEVIH